MYKALLDIGIFQSSIEDCSYLYGVYYHKEANSHHNGHNMSLFGF